MKNWLQNTYTSFWVVPGTCDPFLECNTILPLLQTIRNKTSLEPIQIIHFSHFLFLKIYCSFISYNVYFKLSMASLQRSVSLQDLLYDFYQEITHCWAMQDHSVSVTARGSTTSRTLNSPNLQLFMLHIMKSEIETWPISLLIQIETSWTNRLIIVGDMKEGLFFDYKVQTHSTSILI